MESVNSTQTYQKFIINTAFNFKYQTKIRKKTNYLADNWLLFWNIIQFNNTINYLIVFWSSWPEAPQCIAFQMYWSVKWWVAWVEGVIVLFFPKNFGRKSIQMILKNVKFCFIRSPLSAQKLWDGCAFLFEMCS